MGEKPTLQSLASSLGVSRQTISNVLNNPQVVHASTRDRVLAEIRASGYRPSAAARSLRSRRSEVIGLRIRPAVDGINGSLMDAFLHALVECSQRRDHRLLLITATSDEQETSEQAALHTTGAIDGCVLTDTHLDDTRPAELAATGVPFVAFGRPWQDRDAGHSWVDIDGAAGTRLATEHLLDLGHRRIAFLGWPTGSGVGDDRRSGWQRAMADAGVAAEDLATGLLDQRTDDGVVEGTQAMERALRAGATAAVCASDSLAVGASTVLRRVSSAETARTAVVGFDDTPVAAALGLSSVRQPVAAAASRVVDLLIERLTTANDPPEPVHDLLTPELVLREFDRRLDQHAR
ncbi:LacI family DNA-binding transcriptional regulator [Tersicoccus sp. MR15.9]|uniref:LacI family DNA-binding transcriptional regulator n=1 Tax=Tersicoccus mangrovi TaxID=3121635 RepID=UPI002FE69F4D